MTENNHPTVNSPFFELPPVAPAPRSPRLRVALDGRQVEGLDVHELTTVLLGLAVQINGRTPADLVTTELAADGTVAIKSLVAVCLLGSVGAAVGKPSLIDLRRVNPEELRSVGGVARLLRAALDRVSQGAA